MKRFSVFITGIGIFFALPLFVLVLGPYVQLSGLQPVPYDEETDGQEGFFPAGEPGIVAHGREVFRREGCVNCHTQVIRPTYAGMDSFKRAFGKDPEVLSPTHTRETMPHDFLGQDYALLGQVRNGPDLSNVGYRRPDRSWHHQHLYDPRTANSWSTMPGFRHLYKTRRIQGQPSGDAIAVDGIEEGFEVVPTYDAEALVGYLLAMKNDEKIPASVLKGMEKKAVAEAAAAEGGDQG